MSGEEPISLPHFLATLLPPADQAQLDDESDTSLIKIPTLFYVANYLFATYESTGIIEILDKAISYADQLKGLLSAIQPQLTHEPTTATAAGFLMMLLEYKSNDQSPKEEWERLIHAAEDHLRFTEPETPLETLGTLAHASMQLYYRTQDTDLLARAIQRTREYLSIIESDKHLDAENQVECEQSSSDGVSDELHFATRKNLVQCLAEYHWSKRDSDSLYELINECARSLQLIQSGTKEHGFVQEIMNVAVMAWYFRRLAPQWDMNGLFSKLYGGKMPPDSPGTPDQTAVPALEHGFSSLSISEDVYTKYRLDQGTKQIRILELLPGTGASLVACKLKVVDLQQSPTYDALSYVWGNPKDTKQIKVNDSILNVTANLFRALSRLRQRDQCVTVWVDAICINQRDDLEKEHQIDLMRDVYSSAREVIMWLGEPGVDVIPSQKVQTHPKTLEALKNAWPIWVYETIEPYLDSEYLLQMERNSPNSYLGDDLQVRQIIEHLPDEVRPQFYTKRIADLGDMDRQSEESRTLVVTTLLAECFNAVSDFADLLQQNAFSQNQDGLRTEVFDWRKTSEIPLFFMGPQDPHEWPVLGAFSIAYFLATAKHLTDIPFFGKNENIAHCLSQSWLKSINTLQKLLESAYWKRAWITQEIVLAQNPVIYYGRHIMSFKMLATAQLVLKGHMNAHCCAPALQERRLQPCHGIPIWTALVTSFERIEDCTEMWLQNIQAREQGKRIEISWSHISAFNLTRRYATKPLDHVYGILGLIGGDGPDRISTDYSKSIATVYAKATELVIKTSQKLKVLAAFTASRPNLFRLPSWAMDWSTGGLDIGIGYPWNIQNPDARTTSACFYDDLCMSLETSCVDTVSVVSDQVDDCTDCSLDDRAKVISSWREMAGLPEEIDTRAVREEEFWRTLFADCLFNVRSLLDRKQMTASDVERAQTWWRWICKQRSPETVVFGGKEFVHHTDLRERDDEIDQAIHALIRRKRFFITASGELATARGPIIKGDEIHLVFGCAFPLVLRPAERTVSPVSPEFLDLTQCSHDEENVTHYISDAYVHGIMSTEPESRTRTLSKRVYIR